VVAASPFFPAASGSALSGVMSSRRLRSRGVRVNCHLRHNVLANPLVQRDQCDYLSLFIPDLIADASERREPRHTSGIGSRDHGRSETDLSVDYSINDRNPLSVQIFKMP
jgi:hypothetical protein